MICCYVSAKCWILLTVLIYVEILKIFDIMLQSDIRIIKECKTLNKLWIECLNSETGTTNVARLAKRNLLRNDVCRMTAMQDVQYEVLKLCNSNFVSLFTLTSHLIYHFHMHHTDLHTFKVVYDENIFTLCKYFTYIHSITEYRQ